MSTIDHWMPLYVGDYLADTQHLTCEQHGAYLLLLMSCSAMGSLPDNDAMLARCCRVSLRRYRKHISGAIRPYFDTTDGRLRAKADYIYRAKRIARVLDIGESEWRRLRLVVFERDGSKCTYCGATNEPLECDHIVPVSRGGLSTLDNLATACRPCNRQKSDSLLEETGQ